MRITLAAASAFVLAPTSVFAVDYLSADQAAKLMFPEADRFQPREVTLEDGAAREAGRLRKRHRGQSHGHFLNAGHAAF